MTKATVFSWCFPWIQKHRETIDSNEKEWPTPRLFSHPTLGWPRERLQSRSNSNTELEAQDKIGKCFLNTWISESASVLCTPPPFIMPIPQSLFFKTCEPCNFWSLKLSLKGIKHWLPSQHAPCFFLAWAHPTHILPSAARSLPQGPPMTSMFVKNLPGVDPTVWQHTSRSTMHNSTTNPCLCWVRLPWATNEEQFDLLSYRFDWKDCRAYLKYH